MTEQARRDARDEALRDQAHQPRARARARGHRAAALRRERGGVRHPLSRARRPAQRPARGPVAALGARPRHARGARRPPDLARVGVNTLTLTLGSLVLTLLLAVPIAVHAAAHGDTAGNTAATLVAYVLSALPVFWFGYIVVYVFIHQCGMFPLISGTATKQTHAWLYFLVPIFVLGTASGTLSEMIRHLREELSRVLAEDYIRTARAKGAPVWRHAFK